MTFEVIENSERNCSVDIDNEFEVFEICVDDPILPHSFLYWAIYDGKKDMYSWNDFILGDNGPLEGFHLEMCENGIEHEDDIDLDEIISKSIEDFLKRQNRFNK